MFQILLILSVLFDFLLCVGLFGSLIYYWSNGKQFSNHYLVGFIIFFILFIAFIIALVFAMRTHRIRPILLTVVVTVGRFLAAIVVVIAWLANYDGTVEDEKSALTSEDPYKWISNRKGLLLAFTAIYIPIFCIQLFVLNR